MASRMIASFWGWRSRSMRVEQPVAGTGRAGPGRASTRRWPRRASPEHSPWPRNGGVRWAASPTSENAAPAHLVGEHRAELVDGAAGQRAVLRPVPRLEQRPHPVGVLEVRRLTRRASSMNSQRRCRGPLWTCVVGRFGSHHWQAIGRRAKRAHVVRLDVDDQPALLEAQVATALCRASRGRTSWRRRRRRASAPVPCACRRSAPAGPAPPVSRAGRSAAHRRRSRPAPRPPTRARR